MSELECLAIDEENSVAINRALSWKCAFLGCDKLRVFEGGRCWRFPHLDTCIICGCRVATAPIDHALVAKLVDEHLQ